MMLVWYCNSVINNMTACDELGKCNESKSKYSNL